MVWVNGIIPLEAPRDKSRNLVTSQSWAWEKQTSFTAALSLWEPCTTAAQPLQKQPTIHCSDQQQPRHALSKHSQSPTSKMLLLALEVHFIKSQEAPLSTLIPSKSLSLKLDAALLRSTGALLLASAGKRSRSS